jgi:hypothetical protein
MKMKKILFVFTLIAILGVGTAFADYPSGLGIGVHGGAGGGWSSGSFGVHRGAAVSLKLPDIPFFWEIDISINSSIFYIGVAGDYYFIHSPLVSEAGLHWYIGGGAGLGIGIGGGNFYLSAVGRLPIGLSWQLPLNAGPIDTFEVYLQVVPSIGVDISPSFNFPAGGWPINLGVRVWF